MQINIENTEVLFPAELNLDRLVHLQPLEPFAEESIDFLNAISIELKKNPNIRDFPDLATFSFFCRKANILQLKKLYSKENSLRLGRGVIFHIAPSNVPINFAYSLICGIITGNINIVRVPSKPFKQIKIICDEINTLAKLEKFKLYAERIVLVRYDRQSSATSLFSSICDVRVIWGGDTTIEQIRKCSLPPRSFDITFADRYSFCVINGDKYLYETDYNKIARNFFNDTYLFDQNACTSPHLVVWIGKETNVIKAKKIFWGKLYEFVRSKYYVQPVIAVDKLTSLYNQAAQVDKIKREHTPDNLIWRIALAELPVEIEKFRCTSGYFSEYHANSLSDISHIINRKYQTLSYYGFDCQEFENLIEQIKPSGIDRIVPIGKTTDFSLTWDGYNLVETLSRNIDIQS